MQEELIRAGDTVTIRKGAPLPPDGKRKLFEDFQAKVISVEGRKVKVATSDKLIDDVGGRRTNAPFLTFDLSYVYKRD